MTEILLILVVILLLVNLFFTIRGITKPSQVDFQSVLTPLDSIQKDLSRFGSILRDEFSTNREETNRNSKEVREELSKSFHSLGDSVSTRMTQIAELQKGQLDTFANNLSNLTQTNDERLTRLTDTLATKLDKFQERAESSAKENRDELKISLKSFEDQFKRSVSDFNDLQNQKFDTLTSKQTELLQTAENRLDKMRDVVESKLKSIQDDNTDKLEKMRQTVDEKLQKTLDERLGESFKIVSDRLEQVHKGLGEMQTLANGVGDLKKVLSNVRTRGSLGEYRLEMILEQILAPEQYQKAVATKPGSRENVEFVINIPSKESENDLLLLPIDSKFPQDKYQAVLDAYDKVDPVIVEEALKELEKTVKNLAKDIRDKYINPPITTDFAIMFLPFEGLYAEVVKRSSLFETLQKDYKITIVGPTTCAAFLHSLQMGFRTLAIQKHTTEVWDLLRAVKTEFGRFATILDGVEKNLSTASNKIQDASRKSRTIERKLKNVEALPQSDAINLLGDDLDIEVEESIEQQSENPE